MEVVLILPGDKEMVSREANLLEDQKKLITLRQLVGRFENGARNSEAWTWTR